MSLTTTIKRGNLGPVWDKICSRSVIVFLSQLFVFLFIIFGCFWRFYLLKTCDESNVCIGILCSEAGYILPSPRL